MREILFRGKRVDNGEWIQGIYYPVEHTGFSIPGGIDYYIITRRPGGCKSQIQVIPETIGQFTGLTDKNGNKIFEGDIVQCVEAFALDKIKKGECYVVDWFDEGAMFEITKGLDSEDFNHCTELQFKIIGNIHDNPELLKGTKNQ